MLKKGQDPSGVPLTGNDRFEGTVKIIYAYEFSSPYRNYARSRCKSRAIQSARMCCRTDLLHTTQQVRSTIYTAWAKDMSVLQISAMCDCSAFFLFFFFLFLNVSRSIGRVRHGAFWVHMRGITYLMATSPCMRGIMLEGWRNYSPSALFISFYYYYSSSSS